MPPLTTIDDLTDLSVTGAVLERILKNWVIDLGDLYGGPDIVTMGEAIGFLARLTAIRKSLINISRSNLPQSGAQEPVAQPPSAVISPFVVPPSGGTSPDSSSSSPTDSPQTALHPLSTQDSALRTSSSPELSSIDLPEFRSCQELQEIRSLRALPLSAIRPALNQISEDLRTAIDRGPRRPPVSMLAPASLEIFPPDLPLPYELESSEPESSEPESSEPEHTPDPCLSVPSAASACGISLPPTQHSALRQCK